MVGIDGDTACNEETIGRCGPAFVEIDLYVDWLRSEQAVDPLHEERMDSRRRPRRCFRRMVLGNRELQRSVCIRHLSPQGYQSPGGQRDEPGHSRAHWWSMRAASPRV